MAFSFNISMKRLRNKLKEELKNGDKITGVRIHDGKLIFRTSKFEEFYLEIIDARSSTAWHEQEGGKWIAFMNFTDAIKEKGDRGIHVNVTTYDLDITFNF